jgi:hypothetical protein
VLNSAVDFRAGPAKSGPRRPPRIQEFSMSRNTLYIVIAVLAVGVAVIGYQLYREQQEPSGLEINIGESGVSVETN